MGRHRRRTGAAGRHRRLDRTPSVLAQRDFRWYFVGQCASLLGNGMNGVAMSFAVLQLTGSPGDLGLVLAAQSISMVAVLLIGGVIADRFPRHRLMMLADTGRLFSQGVMAALLVTGHARVWHLVLLQVVNGAAAAVFTPASVGLLPDITPSERLQQANALRGLAQSLGGTVGPALAGILIAATNPGWALAVDAATFAVSVVTLAALRPPVHRPPPSQPFGRDLLAGWSEIRSRSWVWGIVVLSAATNVLSAAFLVLGPAAASASLRGATSWATIMAAFGAGSALGGLIALRLRPRYALRTGVVALGFLALPTVALAARLPVASVAVAASVGGLGVTMFNALWETTLQRRIPRGSLSRVSAFDWFASFGCQPIGQAAVGPAAAALGMYPALWYAGVTQAFVTIGTLAIPSIRSMRSTEPAAMPAGAGERAGLVSQTIAAR